MGFAEKRRRRGGKFGEANDFAGRVFQGTAQLLRLLMAGVGIKIVGKKKRGADRLPAFIVLLYDDVLHQKIRSTVQLIAVIPEQSPFGCDLLAFG